MLYGIVYVCTLIVIASPVLAITARILFLAVRAARG